MSIVSSTKTPTTFNGQLLHGGDGSRSQSSSINTTTSDNTTVSQIVTQVEQLEIKYSAIKSFMGIISERQAKLDATATHEQLLSENKRMREEMATLTKAVNMLIQISTPQVTTMDHQQIPNTIHIPVPTTTDTNSITTSAHSNPRYNKATYSTQPPALQPTSTSNATSYLKTQVPQQITNFFQTFGGSPKKLKGKMIAKISEPTIRTIINKSINKPHTTILQPGKQSKLIIPQQINNKHDEIISTTTIMTSLAPCISGNQPDPQDTLTISTPTDDRKRPSIPRISNNQPNPQDTLTISTPTDDRKRPPTTKRRSKHKQHLKSTTLDLIANSDIDSDGNDDDDDEDSFTQSRETGITPPRKKTDIKATPPTSTTLQTSESEASTPTEIGDPTNRTLFNDMDPDSSDSSSSSNNSECPDILDDTTNTSGHCG